MSRVKWSSSMVYLWVNSSSAAMSTARAKGRVSIPAAPKIERITVSVFVIKTHPFPEICFYHKVNPGKQMVRDIKRQKSSQFRLPKRHFRKRVGAMEERGIWRATRQKNAPSFVTPYWGAAPCLRRGGHMMKGSPELFHRSCLLEQAGPTASLFGGNKKAR